MIPFFCGADETRTRDQRCLIFARFAPPMKKSLVFPQDFFAVPTRLELATSGVTGRYSNQLNYSTSSEQTPLQIYFVNKALRCSSSPISKCLHISHRFGGACSFSPISKCLHISHRCSTVSTLGGRLRIRTADPLLVGQML